MGSTDVTIAVGRAEDSRSVEGRLESRLLWVELPVGPVEDLRSQFLAMFGLE